MEELLEVEGSIGAVIAHFSPLLSIPGMVRTERDQQVREVNFLCFSLDQYDADFALFFS
jgi:hypothetical protein